MGRTPESFGYVMWQRVLIAAILLVLVPLFILASCRHPLFPSQKAVGPQPHPSLVLSGHLEYVQGTQLVWQIPPSQKAVLFIAHGCHCRATFFWDKSSSCSECIGLPEERTIISHALMHGYAVIAISSTRECWSLRADKTKVLSILSSWIRGNGLDKLPIVGLGASSGGFFVSALAMEHKFSSLVIMISEGKFQTLQVQQDYPPTLFVHMVKDKRRASLIRDAMNTLSQKGVDTGEVKCYELPITPQLFTRIPGMDMDTSSRIYRALKSSSMMDNQGFLKRDGRSLNWLFHVRTKRALPELGMKKWELHVQELLNLAYGYHEMTSARSEEIFQWFDTHLPGTGV